MASRSVVPTFFVSRGKWFSRGMVQSGEMVQSGDFYIKPP